MTGAVLTMAIRNIRKFGDDVLRKKCREVDVIDDRIKTLIDDMYETLESANGVGLAAPQVGILKRIAVINTDGNPFVIINPVICEKSGEAKEVEGCLSVPGKWGIVARPQKVKVKALDIDGKEFTVNADGLLAKALCHEIDHLDGIMFVDKVEEYVDMED